VTPDPSLTDDLHGLFTTGYEPPLRLTPDGVLTLARS
jgi:hypothetical protein